MLTRAKTILTFMIVVQLGAASGAFAEDTDMPICETNTGIPGTLFQEQFGTIRAPEGFGSVSAAPADVVDGATGSGKLMTLPNMRYGNEVLVFAPSQVKPGEREQIVFRDSRGEPMASCLVTFEVFDDARHDFSQIGVGTCDFGTTSGVVSLAAGTTRTLDLPDGAAAPAHVLDQLPEPGAAQVRLTGKAPGYATFAWAGAKTEDGLEGLCPVHVHGGS